MKMIILDKNGKMIDEELVFKKGTHHKENLGYLEENPKLKEDIEEQLVPIFEDFFDGPAYMNSGAIAVKVCSSLEQEQNSFYHSLVGSLLFEYFKKISPSDFNASDDLILIANKGEEQHCFDYFLKQ